MELEKYQIGWISFLINEIFIDGILMNLDTSMANFWVHTIKDDVIRSELIEKIETMAINI